MSAARNLQLEVVLKAIDKFTAPFKGVLTQSKAVSKQVGELKNKMKDLDKTQSSIKSFRQLSVDMTQASGKMKAAQERAALLGASLAATEKPTKKMRAEFERAKKEAAQLAEKHTQLITKQQQLGTALRVAGVPMERLSQHQRELRRDAVSTTAALQREQQQLERLGKQSQRMHAAKASYEKGMNVRNQMAGAGAGMAAAGGGALYGMSKVLGVGMDFDAQMSRVQALTRQDKNSPEQKALRQQARQLGADTQFTATEAAQGQGYLAMAGFKSKDIQAAMPSVLDMALAGGTDLGRTSDIASDIMSGFKIKSSEMQRVADVLTLTFTTSNTNLEMLGETMKYVGPIATKAGMGLEETAAMAGLLGNVGIKASQAGTTLRAMLNRIAAPTRKAAATMKALNVQYKDAQGNVRPIPRLLKEVAVATQKMGTADQLSILSQVFGTEAGTGVSELIEKQGIGALDEYIKVLENAKGTAAQVAKIMSDNASGDVKKLSSAWEDLNIQLYETNDGPLRGVIQKITEVVGAVKKWTQENPELTEKLVRLFAIISAALLVMGGFTLALAAALGPMVMLRYGLSLLNIKMGLGTQLVKAATLSYGKLSATLKALNQTSPKAIFQSMTGSMGRANTAVKGYTASIWRAIRAQGAMAASKASGAMQYARTAGLGGMSKDAAKGGANLAVKGGKGLLNGGIGLIKLPIKALMQFGQALAFVGRLALTTPIGLILTGIALAALLIYKYWEPIKAFFTGLWQGFMEGIAPLKALFVQTFTPLMAALQPLMPIWDWMVGAFKMAWEWVSKLFTPIQSTKESLDGASKSGSGFGKFLANIVVIVAEVLAAFISLPIKIVTIGIQIVEGLWQGIAGKWDWLKGKFFELAKMLPEPVQKALDIHSPSRVFAQIGRHTVAGLDQGLTDGKDAPLATIKNITSQMISAASGLIIGGTSLGAMADVKLDQRPPMSVQSSYAPSQAAPIQITINAAPGMDEQKLAQLVAREIAKAERQKQVRSRSRLGDSD
ncbi:phage tail tape measure protein [Iodobacter sp. CM08]|uniref:phage tail tape measure protein n=1 Tax=Iodobacter sp. CM08 TaxID=3085902 RepID=UPI002982B280|nr:phage tail tape measure protein [Iodobacter sp. CM08]MDW5417449.1 phage tail tape measure protein [Iodobacter sp. CM08]